MSGITRYRGDTASLGVKITQDGEPYNLTGCSLIMTISSEQNPVDNTSVIQQNSAVITNAEEGLASFEFSDEDFNYIGKYYYDIQLTDANNKVKTITKSTIKLLQDITK